MSTIYIIQPDDDARKDAINALMDSLDKLYPDEIITHQAIAIKTEIPAVIQLLTSLVSPVQATHPSTLGPLTEAGAPPSPDEKPKARRQPPASQAAAKGGSYKRKEKPDPGGSAAPVAGPSSFPAASVKDLLDELDAQAHQLAPAGDPAAEEAREKNASASQVARWKILDSGKELSDLHYVLKNRKLAPGARVRNKTRGLYEVIEKTNGQGLTLRRLAS
ncbi:MAG TPA: hypothetical protein VI729_05220 [Anaerolineales bacterium]|nr:hypothetical protein [Anaerolineales bacterium]